MYIIRAVVRRYIGERLNPYLKIVAIGMNLFRKLVAILYIFTKKIYLIKLKIKLQFDYKSINCKVYFSFSLLAQRKQKQKKRHFLWQAFLVFSLEN